jgi:hypothetical protein
MAEKQSPGADFSPQGDIRGPLLAAVQDPQRRRQVRVALTVGGGMPEEPYELRFESYGSGELSCGLVTPQARQMRLERASLSEKEASDLLGRMNLIELVRAEPPMPRIPPDSLVGRLEVSADGEPMVIYFMADPGQARDAGQPPPPPVTRTVQAIYQACERVLGNRWKAP